MPIEIPDIWKEFHEKLFNFIRSKVRSNEDAEDILQNVFIKIHNNIDTLKSRDKLTSWVYQVARNTINDCYRTCYKVDQSELDENMDIISELDEKNLNHEVSRSINTLRDELSSEHKEVLTLYEEGGLKHREIALTLGISENTSKSRLKRAKVKLKEVVDNCCIFEIDAYGNVVDYIRRNA